VTVSADVQTSPVGYLQAWESESSYPDETPFVSDIGPVGRPEGQWGAGWLRGISAENITPLISGSQFAQIPGNMGRLWMPWIYSPAAIRQTSIFSGLEFGLIGYGSIASITGGGIAAANVILAAGGTTIVLPASGVSSILHAASVATTLTTSWGEVGRVHLLMPDASSRALPVLESSWRDFGHHDRDLRLSEALTEIRDLTRWLNRSQSEIADICRFSLRASRYWESGKTRVPRPATVRRLHEVHTFVGSLVDAVGRQGAREWLDQRSPIGISRLDVLATPDGITTLIREASRFLFAEAPRPERPRPEGMDAAEAADLAEAYRPLQPRGTVRRPRKAPRSGE
jgi:hypothetical protein